jgi:hypothetical protein
MLSRMLKDLYQVAGNVVKTISVEHTMWIITLVKPLGIDQLRTWLRGESKWSIKPI